MPKRICSGVGKIPWVRLKWPKTMRALDPNFFWSFMSLQFQASHSRSFWLMSPSLSRSSSKSLPSWCLFYPFGRCLTLSYVLTRPKTLVTPFTFFSAIIRSKLMVPIIKVILIDLSLSQAWYLDSRIMHWMHSNCSKEPSSLMKAHAQLSILIFLNSLRCGEVLFVMSFFMNSVDNDWD